MDLSYALGFIARHRKLAKKSRKTKVNHISIKLPNLPRREMGSLGDGWEDIFYLYK